MKTVTKQELRDFIFAQDDDREVKMNESDTNCECGCIMVHFGKEQLRIEESFRCGTVTIQNEHRKDLAMLSETGGFICKCILDNTTTYKDVKEKWEEIYGK